MHSDFVNINSNTIVGSKSELFILNEKKRLCQEQMDSLSFANTELTTHTTSNNTAMDDFGEFTNKVGRHIKVLYFWIRLNKIVLERVGGLSGLRQVQVLV